MKLIWGYQGNYEGWGWNNVTQITDYPENLALFPPEMQTPENQAARRMALMAMRSFDIDTDSGTITTPGTVMLFDLAGMLMLVNLWCIYVKKINLILHGI